MYAIYHHGNSLFIGKKYSEAIEFYTKAIDLAPMVASYYGNRSIAYLQTEAFGYALQDASKSLEVDKNYIKVGLLQCILLGISLLCLFLPIMVCCRNFAHVKDCA